MDLARETIALILAGGNGTRLGELTRWQCKPALSFGGHFRNIDFTLSNCVNSGVRKVAVLTQYKAQSLINHIGAGWGFLARPLGEFIDVWPAQQRLHTSWYAGTADAVHQNLDLIDRAIPGWIESQDEGHAVVVRVVPQREQIDTQVREQLIVELYSK